MMGDTKDSDLSRPVIRIIGASYWRQGKVIYGRENQIQ